MKFRRMSVKLFLKISFALAMLVFILHWLYSGSLHSSTNRYRMLNAYMERSGNKSATKFILFYNNYFEDPFWRMNQETCDAAFLKQLKCPRTNCVFTSNRNLLRKVEEYDAIVFHAAESWFHDDVPATRSPHQVYIMASKESPGEIKREMEKHVDFYNLTMTYRLDSDIGWYYGLADDLASHHNVAPGRNVNWKEPDEDFHDEAILEIVSRKTRTAAWFVSHCNVISRRDELTKNLQKFVDVDIYGKCGNLTCEYKSAKCDDMLNETYRFYLAFENTLCIDYLTEKLFNTLSHYIVPVVYSGADVSRFLPPKSYINAEDFDSAEELADYLKFLIKHPEEYIKYFWWKKHYRITSTDDVDFCAICQKLNEPNFSSKRQVYHSIKEWFYRDACRNPKIKISIN